jgi:2-polyprenyl-6-methoxyphenol hydroxylase-like FAD-dependent oxidoreductase
LGLYLLHNSIDFALTYTNLREQAAIDYLVLIIGAGRSWAWGNKPSQKGDYEMASPCVMSDLPQRILEPILVQEVIRLGSKVCFGTEFVAFQEKEDHVETTLKYRCTGEEYKVKSQYIISADGARRAVVSALGIPIIGKKLNTAFNVHIKADLTKYIAHRPGSLN